MKVRDRGVPQRGRSSRGHTLGEALLSLLLLSLLLHAAWASLRVHGRAVSSLIARSAVTEAGAVTHGLLRRELRAGLAGTDWSSPGSDSIPLRAFRGVGVPCPVPRGRGDAVTVSYRGVRAPNPEKDSLLVLGRDGRWRPAALGARRSAAGACVGVPDGAVEIWGVVGGPDDPVALRVFERGSYHLGNGAFRYRRGRGGRQPLTEGVLDPGLSRLEGGPPEGIRVRLGFRAPAGRPRPPRWTGAVWSRDPR